MDEGQAEDTVLQHARQNSIRSMTPQDILPSTVRKKKDPSSACHGRDYDYNLFAHRSFFLMLFVIDLNTTVVKHESTSSTVTNTIWLSCLIAQHIPSDIQ